MMRNAWTESSRKTIADVAARHGFDESAGLAMAEALAVSGGGQAQFQHPALGGMGQWSAGGMLMIGDMFNDGLKARVRGLADELAGELRRDGLSFEASAVSSGGFGGFGSGGRWWPDELGQPSSTGSQNGRRYAVFPSSRRLAIENDGKVTIYDTGDRQIGGASQQQSGGSTLSFSSDRGQFSVHDLTEIADAEAARAEEPAAAQEAPADAAQEAPADAAQEAIEAGAAQHVEPAFQAPEIEFPPVTEPEQSSPAKAPRPLAQSSAERGDPIELLQKLAELRDRGVLTDAEFSAKKTELLARI